MRSTLLLVASPLLIGVVLLLLLAYEITDVLSAFHAYEQSENRWANARKQAVAHLQAYIDSTDEREFLAYRHDMEVLLGDSQARRELETENPDRERVSKGLAAGGAKSQEIPGMLQLFWLWHGEHHFRAAIALWDVMDEQVDRIAFAASNVHDALHAADSASTRPFRAASIVAQRETITIADEKLGILEAQTSSILNQAFRSSGRLLRLGVLLLAGVLFATASLLLIWMRRNIRIARSLRSSEQRFDMAVSGANEGIWNWSPEQSELYLSSRALQLLGHPLDDLPREPLALLPLVHESDRKELHDAVDAMLWLNKAIDVEFRFLDWCGEYRWLQVRGCPVRIRRGHVVRAAGSISDIGARKRADALAVEKQLQAESALVALMEQAQGRIGRELHDDLGQRLTGVAFLAKALEQRLGQSMSAEKEQAGWIVKLINEVIDRARFMSRQLNPLEIDEVTLDTALQRLVDDIRGIFGTQIALRTPDRLPAMPSDQANHLFRIAQESISNALRHGHATRIALHLDAIHGCMRLAVSDNGEGFNASVQRGDGLGLRNMATRARSLGGTLRVRSTRRGTTIIVRSSKAG